MNSLLWLAIVIVIAWIILRLVLAVTSGLIHLLWVAAIIMLIMWVIGKVRGRRK
jgi:hypothetical protein